MPKASLFQSLIDAFPDASDDTLKALARAQGFIGKAWDAGNKPLVGTGWSDSIKNPYGKFGAQMVEGLTSPIGLGSMLLSGGSAAAGKLGMMGLAKGGLMAEAALNVPSMAQGAYTAATADTAGGKGAGALQAGLGLLGARSPVRSLRRMNKSLTQVPEMLEKARVHGGVSMDPDLGDLGGQKGWAVGGMVAPEGKGTTALANLSTEEFQRYIMNNARAMGKKNQFPGVWQDPDTGKAAMDMTTRLFNPAQATREGILAGQKAIFDLDKFVERPVMGLPTRTRTAILKGGPESMEAYGSPTRFGSMLGLDPGELRGLAQGGDQDAISTLLQLAQDETGKLGGGRTMKITNVKMDAARQHLANELPDAIARAKSGAPALAPVKPKGPGFRPPGAAMAVAGPGMVLNTAEQTGMVDEDTRNADWYKALKALGDAGMLGGLGMVVSKGGWRGLSGKAKGQLDQFELDAAAHPTLKAPQMAALGRSIQSGKVVSKGGRLREAALREGDIPDFVQNVNRPLPSVLKTGPRKGAELGAEAQMRLDKVMRWLDTKGLDPQSIDWTDPTWKSYFNSTKDADIMARLVGALSPQKKLIPNVRDAVSTMLQRNMGIDPAQMASPFGKKNTGFGFGFADADESSVVSNLRKAFANESIGTVYPNKVNEFGEGMIGNVRALPWDMHWSRALGLKSDDPGKPLPYALMKMAGEDWAKSRGFKGAFPGMAKVWTGEKLAVAAHEPGFTELLRRLNKEMPEVLRGYKPKNERDFFETLAQVQEVLGRKLSVKQQKTMRGQAQLSLFDFGR